MITLLRAESFKSWKDTGELRIAPLTGLFGLNSSGKTSILQILLMLKQTVESLDRKRVLHTGDKRSLVDLGTFFSLIHGHRPELPLRLSFSWELPEALVINDPERQKRTLFDISSLRFTTDIRDHTGRAVVEAFAYEFANYRFGMQRRNADGDRYDFVHDGYGAKRVQGRAWPLPPPAKCYGFPDEAMGYYQNTGFLPDFVLALEDLFNRVNYLGPLREYPQSEYVWAGDRPTDVGVRGEHAIAALLAARAEGLKSGRGIGTGRRYKPVEERVLEWMKKMGLIHSFSLQPIASHRKEYEFRVKTSSTSSEVLITDVGFGVSQILPVLVLCYYAPEHSTVLLEQPEIHLHPSIQADLADVLIDVVKERYVQIIVESHSEHLLRRLQRRIAENQLSPDRTAFYFCHQENGVSGIEKLHVDLFGNVTNWPEGFFGDEMGELTAMTRAAMERKIGGGL